MSIRFRTAVLLTLAASVVWIGANSRPIWWAWLRYAEQSYALEPLAELADRTTVDASAALSDAPSDQRGSEVAHEIAAARDSQRARTDRIGGVLLVSSLLRFFRRFLSDTCY